MVGLCLTPEGARRPDLREEVVGVRLLFLPLRLRIRLYIDPMTRSTCHCAPRNWLTLSLNSEVHRSEPSAQLLSFSQPADPAVMLEEALAELKRRMSPDDATPMRLAVRMALWTTPTRPQKTNCRRTPPIEALAIKVQAREPRQLWPAKTLLHSLVPSHKSATNPRRLSGPRKMSMLSARLGKPMPQSAKTRVWSPLSSPSTTLFPHALTVEP